MASAYHAYFNTMQKETYWKEYILKYNSYRYWSPLRYQIIDTPKINIVSGTTYLWITVKGIELQTSPLHVDSKTSIQGPFDHGTPLFRHTYLWYILPFNMQVSVWLGET